MKQPLLTIKNLSIDFSTENGYKNAVQNISLQVNAGEIVALVGESGSGKSVTALSILRLLPSPPAIYSGGTILFSEEGNITIDISAANMALLQQIRGNKISMIFQEPMTSLNPVLTCGRQVAEVIALHKNASKKEAQHQTIEWFEKVKLPNPKDIYHRYPHQLSGGQKQRVMIAMAMCCKPSLLICDEPTTALDVTVQKNILALIKNLQQETGMGVIFITHDLGVVAQIADRAIVMLKGNIVEQGTVSQLFLHPTQAYTKALLACRPVNHTRGNRLPVVNDFLQPQFSVSNINEINSTINNSIEGITKHNNVLMDVQNLCVWFPNKKNWLGQPINYVKAVDNVSFHVFENETLGIVGESGCGKTTLGRTLLQLIPPTHGKILYKQTDLSLYNAASLRELRRHLQIVFQDPYSSLNPRKKIGPAIGEPLMVHGIQKNEKRCKDQVIALLEKVGLQGEHYHRYPHEFSGGQRQRIVIARALALQPSFIICDESVSALDVSVQAQVLNLLNDLKKEFGFTIVFISHDLGVVKYMSNRILVMNKGKIEEMGNADEIYTNPRSEYTKRLIDAIPKMMNTN